MGTQSRLGGARESGIKAPVVVSTVANITLSGEQTINTVDVVAGDRVLVANQTVLSENGVYDVEIGTWTRAKDFNASDDVVNGLLLLDAFTGQLHQLVLVGDWTPDTTEIDFVLTPLSGFQSKCQSFKGSDLTEGNTLATLTDFSYVPGAENAIGVYVNSGRQKKDTSFLEPTSTTVKFTTPLKDNDDIDIYSSDITTNVVNTVTSFQSKCQSFKGSDLTGTYTIATLTDFTYAPGVDNSIAVYLNGKRQKKDDGYTETSESVVTFLYTLSPNDDIDIYSADIITTGAAPSNIVTHTRPGGGSVATNLGTLQNAQSIDVVTNYMTGSDIGQAINAATADGFLYLRIPQGAYTQSTALTQNQEVHLFADGWNEYGFNPVTITKDGDFPHLETTVGFSSLGIEWSGLGVVGSSSGLIMHKKFQFVGSITGQPAHGLEIIESSASHNHNGSVVSGAFASNGGSGLIIENSVVSDSDNIDQNAMHFGYLRCNSNGIDGITFRGGLWNKFYNARMDNNGRFGLNIDANNKVSSNYMAFYAENNGPRATHTGGTSSTVMTDDTESMGVNDFVGFTISNSTDGSSGVIISNTATTITVASLSGGSGNNWELGDSYVVNADIRLKQTGTNNLSDNEFVAFRGSMPDIVTSDIVPDADFYRQGNTARLGGNFRGVIVNAKQPWFQVHPAADLPSVTGNDVVYDVVFGATKVKDTQDNFSSTTFTAPTTGSYALSGSVRLQGVRSTTHSRCRLDLVTTNRTYNLYDCDLDAYASSSDVCCLPWSVIADMGSYDTALVRLTVYGGAQDVSVSGGSGQTYFMGRLLG